MILILSPKGANQPFEILVSCLTVIFPRRPCIAKVSFAFEGFQPISPEQVSAEKLLNYSGQPVGVQDPCELVGVCGNKFRTILLRLPSALGSNLKTPTHEFEDSYNPPNTFPNTTT